MFQLLQNNLEISLSKKDAKNVLLGKSHLCFNQELQKHTLFPLTGLDWLYMDSCFCFFSPHWFPGSFMARFVASSDYFPSRVCRFHWKSLSSTSLPAWIRLKDRWTIAEMVSSPVLSPIIWMKNWPCGRLQYHLYREYCDFTCNLYFKSTCITFSSPKTQSVPNVLTRIVRAANFNSRENQEVDKRQCHISLF